MVKLLLFVLVVGLSFGVSEKEFKKDKSYLERVERRLDEIDRSIRKGQLRYAHLLGIENVKFEKCR